MNNSSPKTASLPGWQTDRHARVARLIGLARATVTVERLAPALWPALGFAGLYLVLALLGVFAFLPWVVQALILAATITAIGLALDYGFANFSWPRWQDGARRLERDSGLAHRPISESADQLVGDDPFAQHLWQLHQARPLAVDRLKLAWPDLDLTRRDPHNLRYLVLLALAVGLLVARGDIGQRVLRGFDSGAGATIGLDAWVDPPAYTGLAPIYLARGDNTPVAVPVGSLLNLRAHGAGHAPGVTLGDGTEPHFSGQDGEYSAGARLTRDAHLRVRASGHTIGLWNLRIIPDAAPKIAFTAKPSRTEHDATQFSFRASDDYGVTGARVVITPHGKAGKPLIVDLPLAEASAKSVVQTTYSDLTQHPYAGLDVDAVLEARDGAGQIGRSAAVTFHLPGRVFTDPLARALIEQRQNLATATTPAERRLVAEALDAFAIAPERFYDGKSNLYLSLRATYWGVRTARSEDDIAQVENLLWQIAVSLEQNGMLAAAEELRQLQALLTAALAAHAPQDVIDALLQRYNQAMQRYMQALANNPQPQAPMQSGSDAKTITQDDIQKLLKEIQQLSASGNREMAAQMLAMLQQLLENLHMAQGKGGAGAQDKSLNDAMQKFGDMMGKERSLMDKTMRQRQGRGDPKDGGPKGLAKQQGDLKNELNQMLNSLNAKSKDSAGDAGKAMDNAQKALGGGDLDNAGSEENKVMDALRKGADALAQQAQQSGQEGKEDPLGRSNSGPGTGFKLPGTTDMAKARAILQELRKRAGERGRPQQELDYFDRLLREF